jgi:hypothetical protein
MRIRVIQSPTVSDVDGIRLDVFRPGIRYEMGKGLGALFQAEGWGLPVASDEPAMISPVSECADAEHTPADMFRDVSPSVRRRFPYARR